MLQVLMCFQHHYKTSTFISGGPTLSYAYVTRDYLRAYIDEMPEKYKGPHIESEDVDRNPKTKVPKSASSPYSRAEMKTLLRDTVMMRLEDDEECRKVKTHLRKFHCEPIPVSVSYLYSIKLKL